MEKMKNIITKIAGRARKAVLLGTLVGGVSMLSYATETTTGPTIEKARLETVTISLDKVVAAITKADPNWVNSLPVLKENKARKKAKNFAEPYYWYKVNDLGEVTQILGQVYMSNLTSLTGGCDNTDDAICAVGYNEDPGLELGQTFSEEDHTWNKTNPNP
mgnify:CR=1 FL=1